MIPKILILIPCWKRPDITQIVFENLSMFKNSAEWDVKVLTILSPGDPFLSEIENQVQEFGFDICYFKNLPVGNKLNAGINFALKKFDFDYLMNFGSDDLIHPQIVKLYENHIKEKVKFFGINNLYFYDLRSSKLTQDPVERTRCFFYHTYNDCKSIGAGRMIHRAVLEDMIKVHYDVYSFDCSQGMDGNSAGRIKFALEIEDTVIDAFYFPYIVDIKTDTNINHILNIDTIHRKSQIIYVKNSFLQYFYPEIYTKHLKNEKQDK